jgi:uncharacterized protein (TIGR00251 family)
VELRIRAVPGAARERIVGEHGDALKVAVHAAPERGKANASVLAVLAAALGLPSRQLALLQGTKSRDKVVRVQGLTLAEVCARLGAQPD